MGEENQETNSKKSSELVFRFLDRIAADELVKIVRREFRGKLSLSVTQGDREQLYRVLFSIFGFDLLYEKSVRRVLLETLNESDLYSIATQLVSFETALKPYDQILKINLLPWKTNSKVVYAFKHSFEVPDLYLPSKSAANIPNELVSGVVESKPLFDYQLEVRDKVSDFIVSDSCRVAMMQLPTGAGKTRTTMEAIIQHLTTVDIEENVNVVWLAHTEELCTQATETFKSLWAQQGKYDINLVRFWGANGLRMSNDSKNFVVAGYIKFVNLMKGYAPGEMPFGGFKLLVIDEAHKSLAPTMRECFEKVQTDSGVKILGLTATPGRSSQHSLENKRLAKLFDNNLIFSEILGNEPITKLQEMEILAKIERRVINSDIALTLEGLDRNDSRIEDLISNKVLKYLAKNSTRNKLICEEIINCVEHGVKCLIFACSVDHAKSMSARLAADGIVSSYIHHGMKSLARFRTIEQFGRGEIEVLLNYGVLSTGFDDPNIGAVIITRPTSSPVLYSQMIGRGMRGKMMGGAENCIVIDIVDNFETYGDYDLVYGYFKDYWR